uniref:non-specific serine/threonine protein kinase n=1 Tax=Oryza glumipatula TaxID=40148 RepID=A0A0D9Y5C8_9ORYZ
MTGRCLTKCLNKDGKGQKVFEEWIALKGRLTATVLPLTNWYTFSRKRTTDTLLPGKSLSGNQVLHVIQILPLVYEDGKLNQIIDGLLIWSSNGVETSVSAVAILLDNGNLVIRDQVNSTMVFWQSFDNPIGILLPGGWLGFNRMTGKNVSLSSKYSTDGYDAYDTGNFILDINANEGRGFTINALDFDSGNTYKIKYSGAFPRWMGVRADGVYKFPQNEWSIEVRSIRECEAACYSDCSCTSFAFNKTCLLWYGELQNTIVFDSRSEGYLMYMRVVEQKQEKSEYKVAIIVVTVIGGLVLILISMILLWRGKRKLFTEKPVNSDSRLMIFSNSQLKNATKGFSEKLGEGGFGCVFKGTLPGFSVVAVKKLKDLRQGEKQFRSEVQTIGMIQHINLVRLLGFCAEGSKRLLVYEYLVNGSLNSHLFSNYSVKLTWNLRYCIAHGIAKGLAYLHEECRHCIIHCDMKPDNVLLDAEFCPKIADFGMAKLLGRDFSRALTTMRGTIGYLAPEWISGLPITHKADVYSYGMMLLEIISGRRNSEKIKEGRHTYFPIYAARKVNEGDVMCLLDRRLDGNADAEQLEKACRIACWCIQDAEDHRPMMGQVVHMLEGVMDVEVPPIPRSLQYFVGMEDNNTQSAECLQFSAHASLGDFSVHLLVESASPYAHMPLVLARNLIQMKKGNKCKPLLLSSSTVILLSSTIFIHLVCQLAYATSATDTLLPGQSLRGNQTLVSKDGSFKLGFNWLSASFGIWFAKSICHELVWEPDKNYSIGDPQSLSLTFLENGTLQLLNNDSLLWSTHYVKKTSVSVILVLLDIGNLVIRDETNDSMVLWQSFDYPSDTILPGGGLGFNKIIGKNISLISPSSLYSLELDTRSRGFIIQDIPSGSMLSGNFPSWMKIREDGTDFVMFYDAQTYLHLDDGGQRKRLLVYEYMPNGSLSSHLFSDNSETLCWQLRYCVALGTARGLAYLHEECMDCIVHCDMKPDNVLLDTDFCPKIADFGMAKLLNRDFSRALTTMRGTIGYLAPEWISGLPITHKADVYSYGLMLLEIISGRRNSEKIKEGRHTYFPIYAACKVNEGDVMCLLDSRLEGNADAEQLERTCRIACWCIQDYEDQRPMMGQVVLMLEGVMDVLVPPIPMSLQNFVGMEDHSTDLDTF